MKNDIFFKKRIGTLLFLLIIAAATLASMVITGYDAKKGITCIPKAIKWSLSSFYPNAKSLTKLPKILNNLKETLFLSISSTMVASAFALLLALFGSNTTKINNVLSALARGTALVFRNIPIVAWAMVLLFSFGQSSLTGFFALFFMTFGFLTRAFIETIDEASKASVEALRATGANYFQIVFQSVIPSSMPQMISWMLYMIETNIRSSTLIGILTGTGIGFSFSLYYKTFNYNTASLVVLVIVITVLIIELISNYVRRVIL